MNAGQGRKSLGREMVAATAVASSSSSPATDHRPSAAPSADNSPDSQTFTIGTRSSKLAMLQTDLVRSTLQRSHPSCSFPVESMQTLGDKDKSTPLHQFNAKALWTHELEALLIAGRLDMIVHSMKDVPTQLPVQCRIGAILEREDPRDAVVMRRGGLEEARGWKCLGDLPDGTLVGTGSVRREAQIRRRHPNLTFRDVRGNVPTRLQKLDHPEMHGIAEEDRVACTILAVAGLKRLGLHGRITQYLDGGQGGSGIMHAVGQGALAIEIRADDTRTLDLLRDLNHPATSLACLAERSLMRTLEGGCSVPIGVETRWLGSQLHLKAIVVALDGSSAASGEQSAQVSTEPQAEELGFRMAQTLIEAGAQDILQAINLNRGLIDA